MAVPMHRGLPQVVEAWNPLEVLPFPVVRQLELNGSDGWGIDPDEVATLWPTLVFAAVWFALRVFMKAYVFPRLGVALGIDPKRRRLLGKFTYQMWLATYYTASVAYGWFFVLRNEPFAAFPPSQRQVLQMFDYYPAPLTPTYRVYYWYQLGFYCAELYALFVEARRSDFGEFLVHHTTTIALVALSYVAHQQRVGAYIFFIHDVCDIFVYVVKSFNYTAQEWVVNINFPAFVASFFFFRLVCFPCVSYGIFFAVPQILPANFAFWVLAHLLSVVLQSLQLMWMYYIVGLCIRMARGSRKDPRSDDDQPVTADTANKQK